MADGLVARLRAAGCVYAEEEAALLLEAAGSPGPVDATRLEHLVERRVGGDPLEQILGWAEFAGLRILVDPGVFVPRRRTELLVSLAAGLAHPGDVVLDLCCGSGALGAALASLALEVYAADLDPRAVASARRNLPAERVFEGDLYAALPERLRGRIDLLVVNAPYVPTGAIATMPPEARLHEAAMALDGGFDGLDIQRRVIAGAADWLRESGHLLIETSERQAPLTAAAFREHGFDCRIERDDERDATAVVGTVRRPSAA